MPVKEMSQAYNDSAITFQASPPVCYVQKGNTPRNPVQNPVPLVIQGHILRKKGLSRAWSASPESISHSQVTLHVVYILNYR